MSTSVFWRGGVAAAVGLSLLAPAVPALTAPALAGEPSPASKSWAKQDQSAGQAPDRVVKGLKKKEPATIVTVTDGGDKPVIRTYQAQGKQAAKSLVEKAQGRDDLLAVTVDHRYRLKDPEPSRNAAEDGSGAADTVNDPRRDEQWALDRLQAESVWDTTKGAGVTVAVLDTGVDPSHADIPDSVVAGPDFTGEGDSLDDGYGHGTHVAGSIAALTDNSTGIAGFQPDVELMSVKVLDSWGSGYWSWLASGIIGATDLGADVLNMSLGGSSQDPAVGVAVEYARSQGVTLVAAAGNDGDWASASYPAAFPGVVGVGATDSSDDIAPFSSRGDWVDVSAPGADILSTVPGNRYESWNGTSMATPHVSALAAALIAAGAQQPTRIMTGTAEDLGDPGRDDDFGHGLINPITALEAATPPPGVTAPDSPGDVVVSQDAEDYSVDVSWSEPVGDGGSPIVAYDARALDADMNVTGGCSSDGATACEMRLESGTYTVEVTASNLYFTSDPVASQPFTAIGPPDEGGDSIEEATALPFGEARSDLIHDEADRDFWRIDVTEAGLLSVDMDGPDNWDFDWDLSVQDADGNWIGGSASGSNDETVDVFVEAGTYYAEVYSFYGSSFSEMYSIQADLSQLPEDRAGDSFATATPLLLGEPNTDHLPYWGDLDYWRIDVAEAGLLTVEMNGPVNPDFNWDLVLYDSSHNELDRSQSQENQEFVAAQVVPGRYYAQVYSPWWGGMTMTDTYTIQAGPTPLPPPPPPPPPGDDPEQPPTATPTPTIPPIGTPDPVAKPGEPSKAKAKAKKKRKVLVRWLAGAENGGLVEFEVAARVKTGKKWAKWRKYATTTRTRVLSRVPKGKPGRVVKLRVRATSQYGKSQWVQAGKVRVRR
ncbi:MAG: S8 family serine peptidase [Actinobacteria bacterium]|nr:S8 family serine peptidase [Actinomycetota bacterium]